jgi:hypothetical protein
MQITFCSEKSNFTRAFKATLWNQPEGCEDKYGKSKPAEY